VSGSKGPCEDVAQPHGLTYTRAYVTGLKCDRHSPNAWAGRPEVPPGPGWPPGAYLYLTPDTDVPEDQEHDHDHSDPAPPNTVGPGEHRC
jgi:hypothetical protein